MGRGNMRSESGTAGTRFGQGSARSPLVALVSALLLVGALCVAVGTVLGLIYFRDVGYPDSATLLKVEEFVRSGRLYPDFNRPPYQVTMYGPLTYVLLAVPYRLAQVTGLTPQLLVRLAIAGAVCLCAFVAFLISRRLHNSRAVAWLSVLFFLSIFPLALWTTQMRGDFLALSFSLLGVYWFLVANGRQPQATGAAICAGMALLVKQTFVAAPIAVFGWLIFRRRYKDAALWAMGVALTVAGGYTIAWWREPLMLRHMAALRHLVFEYREASGVFREGVSQPVVAFAVIGALVVLYKRTPERMLLLTYCVVAWLLAILTIPQVGGNINYFWEPLVLSAILAGPGLCELQQRANRFPRAVTPILGGLLVLLFVPVLGRESRYLKKSHAYLRKSDAHVSDFQVRRMKWRAFVSAVAGHRLLSTFPDVTLLSKSPEIPDPYLNSVLERGGGWSFQPVVKQMNAAQYDLIVVAKGQAGDYKVGNFRGVREWDYDMWGALKKNYGLACEFEGMELWLPNHGAGEINPGLSRIGCLPVAKRPIENSLVSR